MVSISIQKQNARIFWAPVILNFQRTPITPSDLLNRRMRFEE